MATRLKEAQPKPLRRRIAALRGTRFLAYPLDMSRPLRSVRLALHPPRRLWLGFLVRHLSTLWRTVRRLSGDDGYERYLAHHAAAHPNTPALPRRAWFALQQQRKWSGIKRCC